MKLAVLSVILLTALVEFANSVAVAQRGRPTSILTPLLDYIHCFLFWGENHAPSILPET